MANGLALPKDFSRTALSFPEKVRAALSGPLALDESIKALRGGDGLLQLAKDLRASRDDVNAIQRGRFYLIAHIGKLCPAAPPDKRGQGNGAKESSKAPLPDSPFSKPTLSNYRKVAAHEEKIEDYFPARAETDEPTSVADFLNFVGSGGVMATRHGNEVIEWYTPAKYIELARRVMGGIDLDPATSAFAQNVVKAKSFYTAKDDGLSRKWQGRVFLNPPFKQPLCKQFVGKLCDEVEAKNVEHAILLTNDQTDTDWWQRAVSLATAVCFLDGRIGFYNEAGETSCPTNGQTFCYFGKRLATFAATFAETGIVLAPVR